MGSYIGLVKPLHFIRYIYLRFRLLYLILLPFLIRYLCYEVHIEQFINKMG